MAYKNITGLILAGGRARRMGGVDKGLVILGGKPLIAHVVERLAPQVEQIIISANRNLPEYRNWADTVIKDSIGEYDGPLAGMASGLEVSTTEYVLTTPCDSPLLAPDLAKRMYGELTSAKAKVAVASDGKRLQPVFMLIHCSLLTSMVAFLEAGERKIDKWFDQHAVIVVDFSDEPETFVNINTLEEKEELTSKYALDV
ncbi:MAG: molybdenum cofactor guanylyltransferase MobA [Arenicellales bacterium]|nr:molybdenum cofactor guanylyltransferase MobA [Arenicellales bacterium]